jgi:hyperosmotically inducible protein
VRHTTTLIAAIALSVFGLAGCSRSSEESTAHAQQPGADSTYDANAQGTAYDSSARSMSATANPEGDGNSVPADNTGVNKRDRNDAHPTADDQSQSPEDLDLAKRIRQSIESDDTLSANGKNVKVVTRGGMVTLRGPVRDEKERTAIGDKALRIAGTGKVENLLEVAP